MYNVFYKNHYRSMRNEQRRLQKSSSWYVKNNNFKIASPKLSITEERIVEKIKPEKLAVHRKDNKKNIKNNNLSDVINSNKEKLSENSQSFTQETLKLVYQKDALENIRQIIQQSLQKNLGKFNFEFITNFKNYTKFIYKIVRKNFYKQSINKFFLCLFLKLYF